MCGAALIKCDGNVLPLFAHPSGYGRIALAYGKDQVYSIACSMDTDMDALFAQLSDVARSAGRFVMFDLKNISRYWARFVRKTALTQQWQPIF